MHKTLKVFFEYIYLIFVILSGICFRIVKSIINGDFDSAKGYLFAMIDGLMYKPKKEFFAVGIIKNFKSKIYFCSSSY